MTNSLFHRKFVITAMFIDLILQKNIHINKHRRPSFNVIKNINTTTWNSLKFKGKMHVSKI